MMKLTVTILASLLVLALVQAEDLGNIMSSDDSDSDVELSSDDMEALLDSDSDEGDDDRKTEEGCTKKEVWNSKLQICTPECGSGEEIVFERIWSVKNKNKCKNTLPQHLTDECFNNPIPVCDRVCYAPEWKRSMNTPGKPSIRARSPQLPIKGCIEQRDENGCKMASREIYLPETGQCKPQCPSGQEYVFGAGSKHRDRVISPVCSQKCNTPQERRVTLTNQNGVVFGIDKCEDTKGCYEWGAWGTDQFPACQVTTDGSMPSTVGPLCRWTCNSDNNQKWKYIVPVQKNGYRERKCLKGPNAGQTARESVATTKKCCSNPMTANDAPRARCTNTDTIPGQHNIFTKKGRALDSHIHIMTQKKRDVIPGIPKWSVFADTWATATDINRARKEPYQCAKWKFNTNTHQTFGVGARCWSRCSRTCVPKRGEAEVFGAPGVWSDELYQPKWKAISEFKCIDGDGVFGKIISKEWVSKNRCCGQAKGLEGKYSSNEVMASIQAEGDARPNCRIGEMIFGDFNKFRVSEYK